MSHTKLHTAISEYLRALSDDYRTGKATEHTYRPALHGLLQTLLPDVRAINEPKHIACGAPDFVLIRDQIPLGYIETKPVGESLDSGDHEEQLNRYIESLDNLIFTNYLEFRLILAGRLETTVVIGKVDKKSIQQEIENFVTLVNLLETFTCYQGRTITSANDLAKYMAHKARLLARVITQAIQLDEQVHTGIESALQGQLGAFKEHLIHDSELKISPISMPKQWLTACLRHACMIPL